MVEWYKQLGYRISIVDQYTPFLDYQDAFEDNVHPSNDLVYRLIGYQWAPKVLEAIFLKSLEE